MKNFKEWFNDIVDIFSIAILAAPIIPALLPKWGGELVVKNSSKGSNKCLPALEIPPPMITDSGLNNKHAFTIEQANSSAISRQIWIAMLSPLSAKVVMFLAEHSVSVFSSQKHWVARELVHYHIWMKLGIPAPIYDILGHRFCSFEMFVTIC